MGFAEGYNVGKDFGSSLSEKRYRAELSKIQTPEQRAAARAEKAGIDQSIERTVQEVSAPSKSGYTSTADMIRNVGVTVPSAQSKTKKGTPLVTTPGTAGVASVADNSPTLNDQVEYLRESATLAAKHGRLDPDNVIKLQSTIANMKAEGLQQSFKLMDSGDVLGGIKAYNSMGGHRVKLVDHKDGEVEIGGAKVKTKLVTLEDENGNRETVDTKHFLHSMTSLENIVKQGQEGAKQAEINRHNIASEGIDRTKAEAEKAKAGKSDYKVEGSEIATVLGDPAVDRNGKPIMDPLSGRQQVNRNVAKENAFYKWMQDNNITDSNEGLAKYMAQPSAQPPVPTKVPQRPLSSF